LLRDLPGLAILFLMPLLLVLVVTLAQEHATNRMNKTPLAIIDEAGTPLSRRIVHDIDSSGLFVLENPASSIQNPASSIQHPESSIQDQSAHITLLLSPLDSALTLTFDPALSEAEKQSARNTLTFIIRGAQAKQVMENSLDLMFISGDTTMKMMVRSSLEKGMAAMPVIREEFEQTGRAEIKPSVIQNNVPGFILFAMFFIVIPLSASMIAEKNEGAYARLRTLPVGTGVLLMAKVAVYLVVCLLQFLLMLFMGTWLFPHLFGLDALETGNRYGAILVVTIAASLAAIGFGILTGTFARTIGQSALFGSVMVVILGLISGTFLPIHLMPPVIRIISIVSPVRWGIDSYLMIFVRQAGIADILPRLLLLLLFFGLAMIVSIYIFARRK
jgi:ABC-2 type transport system permease protein